MKSKTNIPVITSLAGALLGVLSGAGCASSGNHAAISHDAQCLAGVAQQNSKEGLVQYQSWGFPRGSLVSPLGDAPGESDLELAREWPADRQSPCADCVPVIAQAKVAR